MTLLAITTLVVTGCRNDTKSAAALTSVASTASDKADEPKQNTFTLPDWTTYDLHRQPVQLHTTFKDHQLTIVDFWASWCAPCMREVPNLVALYEQYGGKGLGIVGVSLDSNEQDWKAAIDQKGMTWTQYSELKGWEDHGVQTLGIDGIPFTIVVDSAGTVLTTGLRGEQLAQFVANHLK